MILLGLSARPHLDSGQQALGTKLTLPADFTSREELDRADFYKQLQKVRDGYAYPPAFYHQQDDSKASDALKIAKFVLVCQDGHKPPSVEAAEAYRGPYKIKSQGTNSYVLEGGSQSEDRVTINCLKPFHVREGEEEVDLQPPPRLRRPTRVAKPVSLWSPTPPPPRQKTSFCL